MQIDTSRDYDRSEATFYLLLPFSVSYAILSCVVLVRDASAVIRTLIAWISNLIGLFPAVSLY
jgi:hypothetical protein